MRKAISNCIIISIDCFDTSNGRLSGLFIAHCVDNPNDMRWLSQIKLETKLPGELKGRFYYELNEHSAERIKMVCWSGVVVFTLLLFIDYLRIQAGTFHTHVIYRALFWNHLIGVLLFFITNYIRSITT